MQINVGCGTHRAPDPWVNLDFHRSDTVNPDLKLERGAPIPLPDGSVERVYCGHVFEHVAWPLLPAWLADLRRLLTPGGVLCAVGPDVYRTLNLWKDGNETWELVTSVMEHQAGHDSHWPEAHHAWNCHEQRVVDLLGAYGFKARAVPISSAELDAWPVVGRAAWQFAVLATVEGSEPC